MNIIFLSVKKGVPPTGYWDHAFLVDILEGLGDGDRQVIVIPGAYQNDSYYELNEEINKFDKVMIFVTSDEEGKFDCSQLYHPDMIVYSQYGTSENVFPLGYTTETRGLLKKLGSVHKDLPWFFSGQITHERRQLMADKLEKIRGGIFLPTIGFAQGLPQFAYNVLMTMAMVCPCPPGPISHDSFRLYESLEAGCVPIVDAIAPGGREGYWEKLFPHTKFPVLHNYNDLPKLLTIAQDEKFRNQVFSWWIGYKMELRNKLKEQLGIKPFATTAVVLTSPIKSHPSTEIIDQTIESIRHHIDGDIIIGIDGIRPEQEHLRAQYDEYIRKLLWNCNFEYKNVIPVVFETHHHQSGMMKKILPMIKTPLMLFCEHDTPLVTDEKIDFPYLEKTLLDGVSNLIRFHYEAFIPECHKHLMIGETENLLQKTVQFSARPHIARKDFYEKLMGRFSESSNCFIEDRAYGQIVDFPWEDWKLHIYMPGENIKRSLNLDGRAGDRKFNDEQVW